MTNSPKPIVLLIGEVLHAKEEWDGLAEIAELRVSFLQIFPFASFDPDLSSTDNMHSNSTTAAETNS